MGFDEIMGSLRNQRAKIEEDFEEYKQDYDRREEDIERVDYLYRNMFEENMNHLRFALNVFEPYPILLGQVYQEYQESSEQFQWFINQKRSDLKHSSLYILTKNLICLVNFFIFFNFFNSQSIIAIKQC